MLDSNSLIHGPGKNKDILKTTPEDQSIAAQLLGGDPDDTLKAAKILLERIKPLFLDLNAACPAKKVLRKKSGAYLVHNPDQLGKIINKLSQNLELPITVKLRTGYYKSEPKESVAVAKICEQNGAAAIFVHGRTMKQGYSGTVDYQTIKMIKDAVNIPVFGSGDILSPTLAQRMFEQTNCDGILVARGAMGNPWIFKDIEHYLATGDVAALADWEKRKAVLLKHLAYMKELKETRPTNKMGIMRRVTIMYISSMRNAARLRAKITPAKTYEDLLKVIETLI